MAPRRCNTCYVRKGKKDIEVSDLLESARACANCGNLWEVVEQTESHLALPVGSIASIVLFPPHPTRLAIPVVLRDQQGKPMNVAQFERIYDDLSSQKSKPLPSALTIIKIHKNNIILDKHGGRLSGPPPVNTFMVRNMPYYANCAQKWATTCAKHHKLCQRPNATPLPRRVIDVGHKEAFLIETRGQTGRYATLSHFWNYSRPLKTTSETLKSHLGRLVWNQLPNAFRESISLTRELGMRYLWIDSLCIVQDDDAEWEVESARMSSIYENSEITIVMHQTSVDGRCLGNIASFEFNMRSEGSSETTPAMCRISPGTGLDSLFPNVDADRLSTRGWCFQVKAA